MVDFLVNWSKLMFDKENQSYYRNLHDREQGCSDDLIIILLGVDSDGETRPSSTQGDKNKR